MNHLIEFALFIVTQTGLLVWKLSAISTKQDTHGELLEKVDSRGEATALVVAEIKGHCPGCQHS